MLNEKSKKLKVKSKQVGFSLIEMMIAVSVFAIVIFMSTGAILSIVAANQKSKNLRATTDNVNLALNSMTRTIRFGNTYHCGLSGDLNTANDCSAGSNSLTVRASDGTRVSYGLSSGRITRVICPVAGPCGSTLDMTSSDMTITNLGFWVNGSSSLDNYQPRVTVVLGGYSGVKVSTQSSFLLETVVSQKKLDI